jgi:hypothetical protein
LINVPALVETLAEERLLFKNCDRSSTNYAVTGRYPTTPPLEFPKAVPLRVDWNAFVDIPVPGVSIISLIILDFIGRMGDLGILLLIYPELLFP